MKKEIHSTSSRLHFRYICFICCLISAFRVSAQTDAASQVESFFCAPNMVSMGTYSICKYEVTQAEYASLMEATYFYFGKDSPSDESGRYPAEMVSWYDAIKFCNALSIAQGLTPCYSWTKATPDRDYVVLYNVTCNFSADGYRLATTEEWQKAAFSANTDTGFWNSTNSAGRTQPVGMLPANAFGLYDMSGNVWEWCWDESEHPWKNRDACGGSFEMPPDNCTPSSVISTDPWFRYNSFGFRVVRTNP